MFVYVLSYYIYTTCLPNQISCYRPVFLIEIALAVGSPSKRVVRFFPQIRHRYKYLWDVSNLTFWRINTPLVGLVPFYGLFVYIFGLLMSSAKRFLTFYCLLILLGSGFFISVTYLLVPCQHLNVVSLNSLHGWLKLCKLLLETLLLWFYLF